MSAARELAALARSAQFGGNSSSIFFGTVTAAASDSITVRPDEQDAGDGFTISPVALIGISAPSVNERVCCIRTPGGAVGCIGKVST